MNLVLLKYCLTKLKEREGEREREKRWHAKEAWPNKIKSVIKRSI